MAGTNVSAVTANRNANNNAPPLKSFLLANTPVGQKPTRTASFYNGYVDSVRKPHKSGDRGQPGPQRALPHINRPTPAYRPPDYSSIGTSPSATAQPSTPRGRRKLQQEERTSRSRDKGNVTARPRSRSADRLGGSHTSVQQQHGDKSYHDYERHTNLEKRESRSRETNATTRSRSHSTDRGAATPRSDRAQHKTQERKTPQRATESEVTSTFQKMSLATSNAQQKSTKGTQRDIYLHDTGNSTPGYPLANSHGTTSSRQLQSLHDVTGTGNITSSKGLVAAETHKPSLEASQSHHTSIHNNAPVFAGPVREGRLSSDRVTALDQVPSTVPSPPYGGHTYSPTSHSSASTTSPLNSYRSSSPALSTRNRLSTSGGKVGITNLGNTCFMNSMLQCLGQTGEMAQLFLEPKSSPSSRSGLVKAYSDFMWEMWRGSESTSRCSRALYPRELKDCFSKKNPQFHGYNQHDSQEFMRFLVAGLHEELKKQHRNKPEVPRNEDPEKWWQWYKILEDSDLFSIFVGQLRSSLKCKTCKQESLTFDPFWELSVSLPKHNSTKYSSTSCSVHLQDCLDIFTRKEVLDGAEMPYCVGCKCPQPCTKRMTIERLPRVLIIHLKRFSVHMSRFSGYGHRSKLDTPVTIPHQLNLYNYTTTGMSQPTSAAHSHPGWNYELYAVSNHSGTVYFGHYTAWCKHYSDRKWYSYNDSNVSSYPLHGPEFSSSTAYVLFYRQKMIEKSTIV